MRNRIISIILTAFLLLGTLAGCNTGDNTITEPAYSGVYDSLLFDIYKHILAVTYDPENTEEFDGTMGIREVVGSLSEDEALTSIGFQVIDINSDSISELLIYSVDNNDSEYYYGTRILSAFTLSENTPVLIFEGTSRNRYFLLNDGRIYNEGSSGVTHSIFGTFVLPANATEIKAENYYFTAPKDNDPETMLCYHNTTGDFDVAKSEPFNGSEQEFLEIQDKLSEKIREILLIPFETFSALNVDMKIHNYT